MRAGDGGFGFGARADALSYEKACRQQGAPDGGGIGVGVETGFFAERA